MDPFAFGGADPYEFDVPGPRHTRTVAPAAPVRPEPILVERAPILKLTSEADAIAYYKSVAQADGREVTSFVNEVTSWASQAQAQLEESAPERTVADADGGESTEELPTEEEELPPAEEQQPSSPAPRAAESAAAESSASPRRGRHSAARSWRPRHAAIVCARAYGHRMAPPAISWPGAIGLGSWPDVGGAAVSPSRQQAAWGEAQLGFPRTDSRTGTVLFKAASRTLSDRELAIAPMAS